MTHTADLKLKRKCDWMGLLVETRVDLSNGWGTIPRGTKVLVTYTWKGLELVSRPCDTCGVRMKISRVGRMDVVTLQRLMHTPGPRGHLSQGQEKEAWFRLDNPEHLKEIGL